jgi:CRP-like cAMP-binding protein
VIVPSAGVRALLEHDAPFARRLIEALAARELELCAEIHAAAFHSSAQRLAAYLNGLAQSSTAGTVELPCSKTLIAARLGMKKETLSRLLKRFAGGGLIGVSRSRIAILARERLAAAASAGAAVRFDPGQAGGAALRSTERQGGLI